MTCPPSVAPVGWSARARAVLIAATLGAVGPTLAQDHSFQSQGIELHYRAAGSGIPLVMLSGGPGFDVDYMLPIADLLPAGYQAIFLEQRGTGRSRIVNLTANSLTLRVVVDDLEALRRQLKQERLHQQVRTLPMDRTAGGVPTGDRRVSRAPVTQPQPA